MSATEAYDYAKGTTEKVKEIEEQVKGAIERGENRIMVDDAYLSSEEALKKLEELGCRREQIMGSHFSYLHFSPISK